MLIEVRAEHARARVGAEANRAGAQFEKALDEAHAVYREMGYAMIERRPVDTSPMPKNWLSRLGTEKTGGRARILSKRAGYDFYGALGPYAGPDDDLAAFFGRSVAMEAKHTQTEKTRLPISGDHLKSRGGGLQEHQLRNLVTHHLDYGGVSTVVWKNGSDRLVLLPDMLVRALEDFEKKGLRSVPESWFVPYKVLPSVELRADGRTTRYRDVEDWLQPVFEWMETHPPRPLESRITNPRIRT